jgi:hypothetical protein
VPRPSDPARPILEAGSSRRTGCRRSDRPTASRPRTLAGAERLQQGFDDGERTVSISLYMHTLAVALTDVVSAEPAYVGLLRSRQVGEGALNWSLVDVTLFVRRVWIASKRQWVNTA